MSFLLCALAVSIGFTLYFFFLAPRYSVPILMYHDFRSSPDKSGDLNVISLKRFEQQMAFLKNQKYNVISLDVFVDGTKEGRAFPQGTVVITMDDGERANYTYAYPILRKYGFTATIFLISDFIEGRQEKYITWEQAKEMSRNGISFGGHTKSHMYLPKENNQDLLWEEIAGNKKSIEGQIGVPVQYFAYPIGGFTEEIKRMVERAGYKGACVTNRGVDFSNKRDLYEIHRVSIRNGDMPLIFWAKLSGFYNAWRHAKPVESPESY